MPNSKCNLKRAAVLYEDEDAIVLDKPAGLATQGGAGVTASVDALLAAVCPWKPRLVHRLDKDTSGVLLVAKSARAAAYFSGLFVTDGVVKQYFAVCAAPREDRLPRRGILEGELAYRSGRKRALTSYAMDKSGILGETRWRSFELELGTGRTHQIRRQLAAAGYPVLGDGKYGDFTLNKIIRRELGHKRMFLHACRLALALPDGSPLDIRAAPPVYWTPFM